MSLESTDETLYSSLKYPQSQLSLVALLKDANEKTTSLQLPVLWFGNENVKPIPSLPGLELIPAERLLCRAETGIEITNKIADLEKRFNVSIPAEGTTVKKPHVNFGFGKVSDSLVTRLPTMAELEGLEAALASTHPLSTPRDGDVKVKFYFLPEPFLQRDSSIAMYANDAADAPAVFIYAMGTKDRPATEGDTKEEPAWQTKTFSLHRMMTHELSHYFQQKIGWDHDRAPDGVAKALGWVKLDSGRATEYALKAADGTLYRHCGPGAILVDGQFISTKRALWVPCDDKGEFLKGAADQMLSTEKMAEKAAVKPVTSYFDNPKEMHAEALCAFRLGANWRSLLLRTDKALYEFIKDQDQQEIDKAYRTGVGMLRHPDGHLVSATAENKKVVVQFENAK